MDRLKSKVAIVTGAASQAEGVGNGAAVAMLFARDHGHLAQFNRHGIPEPGKGLYKCIGKRCGRGYECETDRSDGTGIAGKPGKGGNKRYPDL